MVLSMNGDFVGTWSVDARGTHRLTYAPEWVASTRGRPLSVSLPFLPRNASHTGERVEHYFENLLPDSIDILRRMQRRFGTRSTSAMDLLAAIGRDCVGALQIVPEGEEFPHVRSITGRRVSESEVATILSETQRDDIRGARDVEEFRISIAGAQEKTALLYHEGEWFVPHGPTPSTHILKLPLGLTGLGGVDLSLSLENEWLCGKLLAEWGLPVAESRLELFGEQKALVVERFDRRVSTHADWIIRRPLEDFCQATATPPERKYESDGGPGILDIARILRASSDAEDRMRFLIAQVAMWFLGAPDAHAKNFSVFVQPGGRYHLAPLYDVISAWPVVGSRVGRIPIQKLRMAMAVSGTNRHYRWSEIRVSHWFLTAARAGVSADGFRSRIEEFTGAIIEATRNVAEALPEEFPDEVAGPVVTGVERSVRRFRDELVEYPQ
tara:strand:+ start:70 stop:1389 length:1320 start_codon:yes stop_codon:yes gene_type:complete